jgi:uncharacterized membrane protein HdeD (DUF308 family)
MLERLTGHWWLVALRGFLALVFGVIALAWPRITLLALVFVFGIYAIVDGVTSLYSAITRRYLRGEDRAWLVLQGILGIVVGVLVFVWPGITGLILLVLIAAWMLVTGVLQIVASFTLRRQVRNEWMLLIGGILSIIAGLILIARPGVGALALILVIGIYAILYGIAQLVLGFRLRDIGTTRLRPA